MRYCIQQKLGSGGMADVFAAVAKGPEGFERPSVIKRIRAELAAQPTFVKLFLDEAALSARLTHPHIVRLYDFGVMDGSYFLAMEQVLGRDLRWMLSHLSQRQVVAVPAVAAEIARQCALALEYAHGLTGTDGTPLQIVHRDVTPANIMVASDGTVKLLDFGVARTIDPARRSHTDAGVLKGKVSYLAPEQIRAQQVDHRCDLFSLAVVTYELLTWRRLFHGKSDVETIKHVLDMPILPPSASNRAVPAALDRIVLKGLERDPEKRYQHAGEMVDDLERYLVGSRHSGRVMRRLMRDVFDAIWRESGMPDESDTILDPPARATRTGDAGSCVIEVVTNSRWRSVARVTKTWRRMRAPLLVAAGFVAAMLVGGVVMPRSCRSQAGATPPPPIVETAPQARTISVSIDSLPQGASVYSDPEKPALGETPMLLILPRSERVESYTLSKDGFESSAIKVIPDQDKPVLAQLKPLPRSAQASRPSQSLRVASSHRSGQ
jgi:serine/threonine-protein kinase